MHSPSQRSHPHDELSGKDHQSLTKGCAVSRQMRLYPTMHRGRAYAGDSITTQGYQSFRGRTQSSLQFTEPTTSPPAKHPARYLVSNTMHMSLLHNSNELTLSPPAIHRITSSPLPLRCECIGDPALKIFRLSLPRELVGRLEGIIALSERFAQGLVGGWKTELYSLTKQDLALRDIPGMAQLVRPIFDCIIQAIQVLYGCRKVLVDKNQPHILKYSLDSHHTGVQLHHDGCDVTANLVLSSSQDYEGGGTYMPDAGGRIVRLEQGEFLLHPGSLVHGGVDIQRGTRYLMVLFAHLRK